MDTLSFDDLPEVGGTAAAAPALSFDDLPDAAPQHYAMTRGFVSGLLQQNPEMGAEALEGFSYLAPETARGPLQSGAGYLRDFAKASPDAYKPTAGSMWDIKNLDDALAWAGETVGQGIASSLPPLAGGIVGGLGGAGLGAAVAGPAGAAIGGTGGTFAGATAGSYPLNYGEVYKALKDEGVPPARAAELAAYAAVPISALDSANPAMLVGRGLGLGEAKREVARSIAKRIVQEAAASGAREGVTEGAQEAVKQGTVSYETGKALLTKENAKAIAENAVAGFLTGGAMGGVEGVRADRASAPAQAAEPAPVPAGAVPASVLYPEAAQPQPGPAAAAVPVDTGMNVPEAPATLAAQQQELVDGRRPAQMFPVGTEELPQPPGAERVETDRGVFHTNPDQVTPAQVAELSAQGRENELLGLGPVSKAEVVKRELAGEPPAVVTERTPEGVEVKAAAGTEATAAAQAQALETAKAPGNTVQVEQPADVIVGRTTEQPTAPADVSFDDLPAAPVTGTRAEPVEVKTADDVKALEAAASGSYSHAQGEANNRALGHGKWNGLPISMEVAKGGVRKMVNPKTGEPVEVTHEGAAYGYLKGTVGRDNMHVDLYMGDNPKSKRVFVLDEIDRDTGKFRQNKVLGGFNTEAEARAAYLGTSSKGEDTIGAIGETDVAGLKDWLKNGNTKKPFVKSKAAAPRPVAAAGPMTLMEFIASRGGMKADPELKAIGLTGKQRYRVPGKSGFYGAVRATGMDLDRMREAAEEAGYLRGEHNKTSTVRDLLDAIDTELRGAPKMAEGDELVPADRAAWRQADEEAERAAVEADARKEIESAGYEGLHDDVMRLATRIMLDEGETSPDNAVDRAIYRLDAESGVTPQEGGDVFGDEWSTDVRKSRPAPEDGAVASPQSEAAEEPARAQEAVGSGRSAPVHREGAAPAQGRTEDVGADNKPQLVLPGAEKASDKKLAQRAADAPLKPKAPQKSADVGLFSDEKDQTDLLDPARKAPEPKPEAKAEPKQDEKRAAREAPTWAEVLAVLPMHKDGRSRQHEIAFDIIKEMTGAKRPRFDDLTPEQKIELLKRVKGEAKPTAKIEDFGEKIEGARKDIFTGFRDSLNEEMDVATEPLSKSFPQPDYEKLAASGVDHRVLSYIAILRDMIPAKPRKNYKVATWAKQVETARDFAGKLLDGRISVDDIDKKVRGAYLLKDLPLTAQALSEVAPADLPEAAKFRVSSSSYTMLYGQHFSPSKTFWHIEGADRRALRDPMNNDPAMLGSYRDNPEAAVELARRVIADKLKKADEAPKEKSKYTDIGLFKDRATKDVFLGFKVRSTVIRLKAGFAIPKEAREYLAEHRDELQATIDEMRAGPNMRGAENRPRSGANLREGDVAPETFADAFGFRGVQFGNYVEGPRRQVDLNRAFDALMDLSDVLSIPTRSLSLNGSLGIAFGARGRGGKNAAAAHYEPGQVVINLTKGSGPGSLAHEWLHALDNYFAKQDNASGYMSERSRLSGPVRNEVYQAWKDVEKSVKGGTFAERSEEFDKVRSKSYYNTTIEKVARAFERYIIDRLSEKGSINDYLANIDTSGGAYPTAKEMESQGIRAAFDRLFDAIQSRETDQGTELYSVNARERIAGQPVLRKMQPEARANLEAALAALVRKIAGPNFKVQFPDQIALKRPPEGWGSYGENVPTAAGMYVPAESLIKIALADPRYPLSQTIDTAFHEAFHAIEDKVLTDKEMDVLRREMPRLREIVQKAWGFSPEHVAGFAGYEVRAMAFEVYAGDKARRGDRPMRLNMVVRRAFDKLIDLFRRVRNALRGLGFDSADSIFEKASEGRYGDRAGTGRLDQEAASIAERPEDADTAEGRQRIMQGMIARGQPLDRALRVPFDVFGGFNAKGEWKPGLGVYDKAARIITRAKFKPDGRFAFLNPMMESARNGLIDRYSLRDMPDYIERERARSLDERAVMLQGAEVLTSLKDANVGPEEARTLQAILTGEPVANADMEKLASPIRVAVDQLGQEAVALGLLSRESYERNRGSYLHRVYQKHEEEQNGLARMVSSIMGSKRKKLIGDQFKGRGLFQEISVDRLMQNVPGWTEGSRGKPENGEKFIRLDDMGQQGEIEGEPSEKVLRTVWWPEGKAIPAKYADFRNNGAWEVRGNGGRNLTLWRDFTKAERGKMGEILDARYTVGKTFMLMAHDLANGRFYKDISENEDWTSTQRPDGKVVSADEWTKQGLRFKGAGDVGWVKVPDTEIGDTGGKKRWGALSGKYVREPIWRDLNEIEVMQRPGVWRTLLNSWKLSKTARSPVVHTNNVLSNFVLLDLVDGRWQDVVKGLRSYATGDSEYEEAFKNGAFGADQISQEVRDNVLKPILEEISRDSVVNQNSQTGMLGMMSKFTEAVWSKAKAADKAMIELYRLEDEIFRMALYHRRRQLGDSPREAADEARQQFVDYDIRAPWVNAARNSVLPFISYTYRVAPLLARAIATRPWKLAKYATIGFVANALAYAMSGGDEDKERKALRDEEQGKTWFGIPRMMRLPFNDRHGLPMFLDVRRWIPGGDIFDVNQGSPAIGLPSWLQFGGPLMLGSELMLNRQAFTGKDIVNNKTDDWWDKTSKVADWGWKSWMPSAAWVPNSWYWEKIENAARGATDRAGQPYSVPQAMASSFGIKVKPVDVKDAMARKGAEFERVERELETEWRRVEDRYKRNLISKNEYERAKSNFIVKADRLQRRAAETMKP